MSIPSLSPLSSTTAATVDVPAPPKFRALKGAARNVRVTEGASTFFGGSAVRARTEAQRAGLRYEAQVSRWLRKTFPACAIQPVVEFYDDSGFRICRPDAILYGIDRRILIEVKRQHMPEAWWQLTRLYRPVLEAWDSKLPWEVVEIVRSYDPGMPFNCEVELIHDLPTWCRGALSGKFGVHIWQP